MKHRGLCACGCGGTETKHRIAPAWVVFALFMGCSWVWAETPPNATDPETTPTARIGAALPVPGMDTSLLESLSRMEDSKIPALVVVATFDQFRGDYVTRFAHQFGPEGFQRVMRDGYWACDFQFEHAVTGSATGLSVLATGLNPSESGVVGDAWFEPAPGRVRGAVEDEGEWQVGIRGSAGSRAGSSPRAQRSPTVGDLLRMATGGRGKVVSLGMTDLGAVLPGGRSANLVLWWDVAGRQFVSSTYYTRGLPPWVVVLNDSLRMRPYDKMVWDLLWPESWYSLSREDDVEFETDYLGRTFPHRLGDNAGEGDGASRKFLATPLADGDLVTLADKAIGAEGLGRDDAPDLLWLSFSSSGYVGRGYGPFSWEAHDMVLRTDRLVGELLGMLDRRVGAGRYAIVLVGTSGVAPIPESVSRGGVDAGRVDASGLMAGAERYLSTRFSVSGVAGESFLAAFASAQIWLNEETLRANRAERQHVREALRDYLERQQGIARAYTREELERAHGGASDEVLAALAKSLRPDRMGDVAVIPKAYWIITSARTGTATGTLYDYDTGALLMMYGRGVARGVEWTEQVRGVDVARTVSALLRIEYPSGGGGQIAGGALKGE